MNARRVFLAVAAVCFLLALFADTLFVPLGLLFLTLAFLT